MCVPIPIRVLPATRIFLVPLFVETRVYLGLQDEQRSSKPEPGSRGVGSGVATSERDNTKKLVSLLELSRAVALRVGGHAS